MYKYGDDRQVYFNLFYIELLTKDKIRNTVFMYKPSGFFNR